MRLKSKESPCEGLGLRSRGSREGGGEPKSRSWLTQVPGGDTAAVSSSSNLLCPDTWGLLSMEM